MNTSELRRRLSAVLLEVEMLEHAESKREMPIKAGLSLACDHLRGAEAATDDNVRRAHLSLAADHIRRANFRVGELLARELTDAEADEAGRRA